MRSFEVLTHFLSVPRAANYASAIQHSYWSRHTNTVYQLKLPIFKRLYAKRKVQPKTCERRGTNLGLLSFILNHSLCPQLASAKYIDTWIKFIIIIIITILQQNVASKKFLKKLKILMNLRANGARNCRRNEQFLSLLQHKTRVRYFWTSKSEKLTWNILLYVGKRCFG